MKLCWRTSVFRIPRIHMHLTHTHTHTYIQLAHSLMRQRVREAFGFRYFSHTTFVSDVIQRIYYRIKNPVLILLKIGEPLHRLSGFRFPQKGGLMTSLKGRKLKEAKKRREQ